jgi:hypothetical protein
VPPLLSATNSDLIPTPFIGEVADSNRTLALHIETVAIDGWIRGVDQYGLPGSLSA